MDIDVGDCNYDPVNPDPVSDYRIGRIIIES